MTEEDFRKLEPEMRACALVGYYLRCWGFMEASVNWAVQGAFDLDALWGAVVSRNMQLTNKLHILKTMVNLEVYQPDDKGKYQTCLDRIRALAGKDRNIVAHNAFRPDEKGVGVEFYIVKATGKFELPDTVWTIPDVRNKTDELMGICDVLKSLRQWFERSERLANMTVRRERALKLINIAEESVSE